MPLPQLLAHVLCLPRPAHSTTLFRGQRLCIAGSLSVSHARLVGSKVPHLQSYSDCVLPVLSARCMPLVSLGIPRGPLSGCMYESKKQRIFAVPLHTPPAARARCCVRRPALHSAPHTHTAPSPAPYQHMTVCLPAWPLPPVHRLLSPLPDTHSLDACPQEARSPVSLYCFPLSFPTGTAAAACPGLV